MIANHTKKNKLIAHKIIYSIVGNSFLHTKSK